MERTPRETSRYYDDCMYGRVAPSLPPIKYDGHALGPSSSNAIAINTDDETSLGVPSNTGNKTFGARNDEAVV